MTVRYQWSALAQSPLHFAVGRSPGEAMATLAFVPGTAVRGAIAAAFLAAYGPEGPGFRQLAEETSFSHLYPVSPSGGPATPLPLSSSTCRRAPGFLADSGHGVADLLLPAEALLLAAERQTAAAPPPADVGSLVACPRCADDRQRQPGAGTMPWPGYCAWNDDEPALVPVRVDTALEGRPTPPGRARRQMITVRQTLQPDQRFAGIVTFPNDETATLATQLLALQDNRLWVGAGRSRGLGEVVVEAAPAQAGTTAGRLEGLAATLARYCDQAGAQVPESQTYATLTLRSAALLRDAFGRWQPTIGAESLSTWTGLPAGAIQVRQSYLDSAWIEGWNAALGQPKPDARAIVAGSCWLLRVAGVPASEVLVALERLEAEGIGERRQEGFGQVSVCDRLHWQAQELGWEHSA